MPDSPDPRTLAMALCYAEHPMEGWIQGDHMKRHEEKAAFVIEVLTALSIEDRDARSVAMKAMTRRAAERAPLVRGTSR